MSRELNREAMIRQLRDASVHIDSLIEEIRSGEHDDSGCMVLRIPFDCILGSLCLAWHQRWLAHAEIDALTHEDWNLMRDSVPNWSLSFEPVDIDEPARFNLPDSRA